MSATHFRFKPKNNFALPGIDEEILGWRLPTTASKWPFNKGSIWVNVGTSIGVIGYDILGNRKGFFPLQMAVDYSISPHFSVGPYAGFYMVTYTDNYLGLNYESKLTSYIFGARVLMHTTDIINKETGADINLWHWDIYAGISAGFTYWNWNVENRSYNSVYDRSLYPSGGLILGIKYLLSPNIDIYAETGKGVFGLISFGISGKIH